MTVARTTGLGALTVALAIVLTMGANAQNKPTLGGKLELADEGSFFVNGKSIKSDYPGASAATGPAAAGNIIVNQMYVHYRIPVGRERRSARARARLQSHRHDLRDDAGRPRRMGDLVRAPGPPGLRGRSFRSWPLGIQSDAGQRRPRRRRRPKSDADAVPRPDRSRVVEFPVRPGISEAVRQPAVPARGARPVPGAARAQHGNDARWRRRQHHRRRWPRCSTRSARRW